MTDRRDLLDEFAQLAMSSVSVAEFYRQLLPQLTVQLGAAGTAVWTCDGEVIKPFLRHGVDGLPSNGQLDRHHSLLAKVQRAGQPAYVLPKSADAPTDNPTDFLLGIGPVKVDDTVVALIESFHPSDVATAQREAGLQLLRSVAGIAGRFHRQTELRELREREKWWEQYDFFTQAVHASLNPTKTAYAIANEARRIIGCDRVSVLLRRGRKCRVAAISGHDSVNRRANAIVLLQDLVAKALVLDEPFQFPCAAELPPQLDESVNAYLDVAQTKSFSVVPLKMPDESDGGDQKADSNEVIGALVAEQFSGTAVSRQAVEPVARQASAGLGNALQHHRIFLLPIWVALGKVLSVGNLSKTLGVLLFVVVVTLGLIFIPKDFELSAEGTLQPELRRYIFAQTDGVVDRLHVEHGSAVSEGTLLAELRSSEVDLKLAEIRGELQTTSRRLAASKAARIANSTGRGADRMRLNQLAAEEEELRRWLTNLQHQQQLLVERKESLTVRSPIAGEVITWDVQNLLTARPVANGDILMTLANTDGEWVVEVLLKDRRVGHLRDAQRKFGTELDVSFILATSPDEELKGKVQKIGGATIVDQQEGLALPVTIAIDEADVQHLRPGAKVDVNIHCGEASLGYVWFHEVWEFIQSRVLFRF